ncbi:tetraprenyl-beta-curcumene synthase family protein [Longirhabdus pacifica]|uniref:tetraprenyl-beta-curcumene synthase family protein n=1 Tax=Longirhabdus pacifica TaxID=2305227 RepID=UPI001009011D|nr:tetraprenyl-beta-curcumene synthase family protein [Longirhabdus pacifica]
MRNFQYPKGPLILVYRVYRYILPEVRNELGNWTTKAKQIPDQELRTQALASIKDKQFHCEGGAVYAAANLSYRHILIPLIVAFQSISDYLDNLCDRSTSLDEADFRLLHQAMLDAIDPRATLKNYYLHREEFEDGGYLHQLVTTCQDQLRQLPSYPIVKPFVEQLVQHYCDLQVHKHVHPDIREDQLMQWSKQHVKKFDDIYWNEFAAATGSTLGMFMLFLAATEDNLKMEDAIQIRNGYFPYICGVHIILDYLIDQEEDRIGGDLNFCSYYKDQDELISRLDYMIEKALLAAKQMKHRHFHKMIVEGLLAVYLSDPKVNKQAAVKHIKEKVMKSSPLMRLFFKFNTIWIRRHTEK